MLAAANAAANAQKNENANNANDAANAASAAAASSASASPASPLVPLRSSASSHAFADSIYEAICKDNGEKPSAKGLHTFRDLVFDSCSSSIIRLENCRMGAMAAIQLAKYIRNQAIKRKEEEERLRKEREEKEKAEEEEEEEKEKSGTKKPSAGGMAVGLSSTFPPPSSASSSSSNPSTQPSASGASSSSTASLPSIGSNLVRLDISNNSLANFGVFELLKIFPLLPSIQMLNLSGNRMGSKGGVEVARMLASNDTLLSLELGSMDSSYRKNRIEARAASKIALALCYNKTLQYLGMKHNAFDRVNENASSGSAGVSGGAGSSSGSKDGLPPLLPSGPPSSTPIHPSSAALKCCESFSLMLHHNRTLTALNLETCGIGTKGANIILKALNKNRSIRHINLASNGIDGGIGPVLDSVLSVNSTLVSLNLAHNPIGANGIARGLTRPLGHATMQEVSMEAALALSSLPNSDDAAATAAGGEIATASSPSVVHHPSASNLLVLDVSDCQLGDSGASVIGFILSRNRHLTHVNVSANQISEAGGRVIADTLSINPVLTHLNLSNNPVRSGTVQAIAEALLRPRLQHTMQSTAMSPGQSMNMSGGGDGSALLHLDVSSCKVGDEGVIALVSAIGSSSSSSSGVGGDSYSIPLSRIRFRDNYISGAAGDTIVDALYRNTNITQADFRGNQLDHVRLQKIKSICQRNIEEIKDAEPRRLRKEIARLRGEQVKLRKAENTLREYQSSIAATRARIAMIEREKASFLSAQTERREQLRRQIATEKAAIAECQNKVAEKKEELSGIEKSYADRLNELQKSLEKEMDGRKKLEKELATIRKEMEETVKDRPNVITRLKKKIEQVKQEKQTFQTLLQNIRKELIKLQQAYHDGQPIPHLLQQAKALLVTFQETIPKEEPETEADAEGRERGKEEGKEKDGEAGQKEGEGQRQASDATSEQDEKDEEESAVVEDPDEDPDMRELRLMVEAQMKK